MIEMKNVDNVPSYLNKMIFILLAFMCWNIPVKAQTSGAGSLNKSLILYAGAAETDITPAMGIQIPGGVSELRHVQEIRDRIYARALVLKEGDNICCLVSTELGGIDTPWDKRIREMAARRTGISPDAILIHALQLHAAAGIGDVLVYENYKGLSDDLWWVRGGDPRYNNLAVDSIVDVIVRAASHLEPVTATAGRDVESRVAFNRRFIMRKREASAETGSKISGTEKIGQGGTVVSQPGWEQRSQILQVEGPIDPEVGVVLFTTSDGRNIAALLHHTCHPTNGYPGNYVTSDWPGAWANSMKSVLGKECIPLVLNGCCGNIHHHNFLDNTWKDDPATLGARLFESSGRALKSMHKQNMPMLAYRFSFLRIPMRKLTEDEVQAAKKLLKEHPEPMWTSEAHTGIDWDWAYAHSTLSLWEEYLNRPYFDCPIQVIRITDNLAVVALPGEPFVEGQLHIKQESPFNYTLVSHDSNGYPPGYIPTAQAIKNRGYETQTAKWSMLCPEALDMISARAIELLNDLAARK
jgi:neutral ceramidase